MHLHATIISVFPEMFPGTLGFSLAGKALEDGIWGYKTLNLRDFGLTKHKNIDDTPFGGGAGMVIRPDVVDSAIKSAIEIATNSMPEPPKLIYLSPRGRRLDQPMVKKLVNKKNLVILCGRFEGVDQRVLDFHDVEEISVGDFILSGGDVGAMLMLDACIRLLPDVVGDETSLAEESFSAAEGLGLLEYPLYTRPAEWEGIKVPEVLTSGNHAEIKAWRQRQSEEITRNRRPDIWDAYRGLKTR